MHVAMWHILFSERRKGDVEKTSQFIACLGEMAVVGEGSDVSTYTEKWFSNQCIFSLGIRQFTSLMKDIIMSRRFSIFRNEIVPVLINFCTRSAAALCRQIWILVSPPTSSLLPKVLFYGFWDYYFFTQKINIILLTLLSFFILPMLEHLLARHSTQ